MEKTSKFKIDVEKKKEVGRTIATFVMGIAIGSIAQFILSRSLKEYAQKRKKNEKKKQK